MNEFEIFLLFLLILSCIVIIAIVHLQIEINRKEEIVELLKKDIETYKYKIEKRYKDE